MSITNRTRKMLWGRSASRCAYPDCRLQLIEPATDADRDAVHGEEAHIVAQEPGRPRRDAYDGVSDLDDYANLILLCRNHHGIVDAQPNTHTVEVLRRYKQDHEAWITQNLDAFDNGVQRQEEQYAAIVDGWVSGARLDRWDTWTSSLVSSGQPSLRVALRDSLTDLSEWIVKRVWPGRYTDLEAALKQFQWVLNDMLSVFGRHAYPADRNPELLETQKFYKLGDPPPDEYHRRLARYDWHVDLVEDLTMELTRAGNLVCDEIRRDLLPAFRLNDGRLSVTYGPLGDLTWRTVYPLYRATDGVHERYPGLEEFMDLRAQRDIHFGEGAEPALDGDGHG